MASFRCSKLLSFLGLAAAVSVAGCHGNQSQQSEANSSQPAAQQDQASADPASANLAPVAYTSGAATSEQNESSPSSAEPESAASPDYSNVPAADDSADESDYGIQPEDTAAEPPPALPEYDQPPCPGDGYMWTPGYWYYGPSGYYWVPGAWVQAPYEGALWTPGYWGYSHNRYVFFHGYWGPHIGFYGGIDYGFGYVGLGYQGGYWNGGHFLYNREANNINVTVVHNVYNRTIVHTTIVNHVSYNGGQGGIRVRPRPAELAALREPHAPPMRTQLTIRHDASQNRAQFASVNHGRPERFTAEHPVAADHNVRPVRDTALHNLPPLARPQVETRSNATPENHVEPGREPNRPETNRAEPSHERPVEHAAPARPEPNHTEPNRAEPNRAEPNRAEPNRAEPTRREPERAEPNHAEPGHAAPEHTQPERRPAPPQEHAAPHQEHGRPPAEHKDDQPKR